MKKIVSIALLVLFGLSIFVMDSHGYIQSDSASNLNASMFSQALNVVYQEIASNKPQFGSSWTSVMDDSTSSGLAIEASSSSPNGSLLFGPYLTVDSGGQSLAGKQYAAAFRLKVSSNLSSSNVVYIDVCYNSGTVIRWMTIKASDFALPNSWQNFQLRFIAPDPLAIGLEFRIVNLNNGVADVFADNITLSEELNDSNLFQEGACSKPRFGDGWSTVQDQSSISGLVMEASSSSANGARLFGPYLMAGRNGSVIRRQMLIATFRLKVSTNLSAANVVRIDVYCQDKPGILRSAQIKANAFASSNAWQDFSLSFYSLQDLNTGLEFRITNLNSGVADIYADTVTLTQDASVLYVDELQYKPQSGNSWSWRYDSTSSSTSVRRAPVESPNGDTLFGPYIVASSNGSSLLGNAYVATFRLKVSSNLRANNVTYIDVLCDGNTVLQSKFIAASDFVSSDQWQEFQLAFRVPFVLTAGLEFRIVNLNHDITELFADKTVVRSGLTSPDVFMESACNKFQFGYSWSNAPDASSQFGLVMKASASFPNGSRLFGPYITKDMNGESLSGRQYNVTFRLKASANSSVNTLVKLDVACNTVILRELSLIGRDFASPNTWQNFTLTFTAPTILTVGLEFRLLNTNNGLADVYVDEIVLTKT